MPAPYSDNLYSNPEPVSDDENSFSEEEAVLSPVDGYFHASSTVSDAVSNPPASSHRRQSSNVPLVPNVLVEDPTLRRTGAATADDKAREAEHERLINTTGHGHSSPTSTQIPYPSLTSYHNHSEPSWTAASSTRASASHTSPQSPVSSAHYHRRSVDEGPTQFYAASSPSLPTQQASIYTQNQGEAPPAYSPTSPTSNNYQTFPSTTSRHNSMGVPEEHQSLLARYPESMGGQPQGPPPPLWQRIKEAPSSTRFRSKIKTLLGILVVFSILFAIFGSVHISSGSSSRPPPLGGKPVKKPNMDDSKLEWKPSSYCYNEGITSNKANFDAKFVVDKSLSIVQTIERSHGEHGWRSVQVSGDVIIRPTTNDKKAGTIDLEVITNDNDLEPTVEYKDGNAQLLKITTKPAVAWTRDVSGGPCIQIRVTAWVPQEANLRYLDVSTVSLDISVVDGLVLGVADTAKLGSVSGDVLTPWNNNPKESTPYALASRRIYIKTVSGDVSGWYPLYDVLDIDTSSGDIKVDVAPEKVNKDRPEPASLKVHSISGTVRVDEDPEGRKTNKLPDRDYRVDIQTTSGHITSNVAVGQVAKFESVSGNLDLILLPFLHKTSKSASEKPMLRTQTKSGANRVSVFEPIFIASSDAQIESGSNHDVDRRDASKGLTSYVASHQSISGDITLKYPSSWEGRLRARGLSSTIKVRGKDVRITRRSGLIDKGVDAEKGDGDSTIDVQAISGNIDVLIGKE